MHPQGTKEGNVNANSQQTIKQHTSIVIINSNIKDNNNNNYNVFNADYFYPQTQNATTWNEIQKGVINYRSALCKSFGEGKPPAPKCYPKEPNRRAPEALAISALGVENQID